jgi:hypothetical protein
MKRLPVMLSVASICCFLLKTNKNRPSGFWSPMDSTGVLKSDLSRPGARSSGAQCARGMGVTYWAFFIAGPRSLESGFCPCLRHQGP